VGGGFGVGVRPRRGVFCSVLEEASLSLMRVPEPGVLIMLAEETAMARWMGRRWASRGWREATGYPTGGCAGDSIALESEAVSAHLMKKRRDRAVADVVRSP
jgi:hypothetical protein